MLVVLLVQVSLSVLVPLVLMLESLVFSVLVPLVLTLESLVFWWYRLLSVMILVMMSLTPRSSILDIHELDGRHDRVTCACTTTGGYSIIKCTITGGYSIVLWYTCNAWMNLVMVLYWLGSEKRLVWQYISLCSWTHSLEGMMPG